MALVSCGSCGHRISSWARSCPKCGYPAAGIDRHAYGGAPVRESADGRHDGVSRDVFREMGRQAQAEGASPSPLNQEQQPKTDEVTRSEIIELLDIDSNLRHLYRKIAVTGVRSHWFGIHRFETDDSDLKYFCRLNTLTNICSTMALLLGPFYYILHRVWRKGAVLIAAQLLFSAGIVFGSRPVAATCLVAMVLVHLICCCSAKYDRYRSTVLEESFWW